MAMLARRRLQPGRGARRQRRLVPCGGGRALRTPRVADAARLHRVLPAAPLAAALDGLAPAHLRGRNGAPSPNPSPNPAPDLGLGLGLGFGFGFGLGLGLGLGHLLRRQGAHMRPMHMHASPHAHARRTHRTRTADAGVHRVHGRRGRLLTRAARRGGGRGGTPTTALGGGGTLTLALALALTLILT